MLHRWALIFIAMSCFFGSGHADSSSVNPAFAGPWYLTEDEDASWASDPSLVHPESLVGWHSYSESTVPMGLNKTVWLRNELPWIPDGRYILYFASGLEDLSVYIDGQLVYSFGQFTKQTIGVSPQRWHMITLGPQHSHKPLMIRTHYAIGYMLRTLYPTIRDQTEVMAEHARSFVPIILAAGAFGALGLVALVIALMRRQADIFFYFGLMSTATCSWLMFNQDSLVKPYVGLSEKSWEYFDLFGIYIIIASFFSFLADAVQSRSPWVRSVIWLNWGLLTFVALAAGMGLVHAWYFIPVLHIILLFGLAVMIPLIIRSAIQKHADARLLMAGSLALSLTVFHDLAHYSPSFQSPIPTMAPIGGFVVISLMVMILARRYQAEREEAFATQTQLLDNIKALNTELQNQLERVEALVEEKTRAIRSIMGHIQQGIFLLTGSDFSIHEEYSKFLEVLLDAKDLAHKSFARCFLDKCRMDEDQRSRFLSALVASMGEAVECFDMNVSNLPTEVYIAHGENEKIVELSWAPMVNELGVVDKILVAARDITSWRQLQLLAQKSQEEMELLQVILQAKPERFSRFLDSCHQLLGEVRRALEAPHHNEKHGLQEVFRALHTLKGNARSFNLGEIASLVHVAENVVQLLQQELRPHLWSELKKAVDETWLKIDAYKDLFHKKLRFGDLAGKVGIERLPLERIFLEKWSGSSVPNLEPLETMLLPKVFAPVEDVFAEITSGLSRIAEDLGKLNPRIDLDGTGFYFSSAASDLLINCFGHLVRNSLDHGLETLEERLSSSKPPQGCLRIELSRDGQQLKIKYSDDGRGLDARLIRHKALERGLLRGDQPLSTEIIDELIFHPGFSTKSQASMLSGRGVGLDAVRDLLHRHKGEIRLQVTEIDEARGRWYFFFQLTLPSDLFIEVPSLGSASRTRRAS